MKFVNTRQHLAYNSAYIHRIIKISAKHEHTSDTLHISAFVHQYRTMVRYQLEVIKVKKQAEEY